MNNIKRCTTSIFFLFLQTFCLAQFEVQPTREPVGDHFLERIDCRIPRPVSLGNGKFLNYSDQLKEFKQEENYITWGHEGTHFINAGLRYNKLGQNGIYIVGLNQGYLLKEPAVNTSSVFNAIPNTYHCEVYKLYRDNTKLYWQDHPLYIYDEFSAYVNGSCVASQYSNHPMILKDKSHTINAYKLGYFSLYLFKHINKNYDNYYKLKDVTQKLFTELKKYENKEQAKTICTLLTKDEVMLKFSQDEFRCNFFGD